MPLSAEPDAQSAGEAVCPWGKLPALAQGKNSLTLADAILNADTSLIRNLAKEDLDLLLS